MKFTIRSCNSFRYEEVDSYGEFEINTVEDLVKVSSTIGHELIIYEKDGKPSICAYDCYIE